jgi:hypothetical protein
MAKFDSKITKNTNKGRKDQCPLCQNGAEDVKHFLMECPVSAAPRKALISYLSTLLSANMAHTENSIILQLIIDSSHPSLQNKFPEIKNNIEKIEDVTRWFCFKAHYNRAKALGYNYKYSTSNNNNKYKKHKSSQNTGKRVGGVKESLESLLIPGGGLRAERNGGGVTDGEGQAGGGTLVGNHIASMIEGTP